MNEEGKGMKVVINKRHSGFGLSLIGKAEYLKRKGKKAYFYKPDTFLGEEYTKIQSEVYGESYITVTYDFGDHFLISNNHECFYDGDIERNDPDLVAVVEQLKDEADGYLARLKVVEIPDNIKWEIEEADGFESVEEVHRTW